jgi:CheY-like chemotaxis protein
MSKVVFIVEDDLVQQKMLQHHFEEMLGNYTVRTFTDPDDLFAHLGEKPFAVVLDHFFSQKKDKTGLDYLKELKKKRSSIPVVYYTSCTDEAVREMAVSLGAEYFIQKNSASLVRLRTALDSLNSKKKGFLQGLFKG